MRITREIVLDGDLDEVWQALTDDEARGEWLEDDRPLDIVRADVGHSLTWRWATPDAYGVESTVCFELESTDDGRTRLVVTEQASAAATCSLAEATVDVDAWDQRLLGLELRCTLRAHALAHV